MLKPWQHTALEFVVVALAWFGGLGVGLGLVVLLATVQAWLGGSLSPILALLGGAGLLFGSALGSLFLAIRAMARIPAQCPHCGGRAWVAFPPPARRKIWRCEDCGQVMVSGWTPKGKG